MGTCEPSFHRGGSQWGSGLGPLAHPRPVVLAGVGVSFPAAHLALPRRGWTFWWTVQCRSQAGWLGAGPGLGFCPPWGRPGAPQPPGPRFQVCGVAGSRDRGRSSDHRQSSLCPSPCTSWDPHWLSGHGCALSVWAGQDFCEGSVRGSLATPHTPSQPWGVCAKSRASAGSMSTACPVPGAWGRTDTR